MAGDNFYVSHNLEKYPHDGRLNQCKKCVTMHVDNWNPDTYLWILQELDVPYVPAEWDKLLARYGQNKEKLTGSSIFGRYLSKMQLKQWRDYRWKDSEYLQDLDKYKTEQAMKRAGYDAQEINSVISEKTFALPTDPLTEPEHPPGEFIGGVFVPASQVETEEFESDLTDEDKTMLRIKWGKGYRPSEWIALEKLYEEMMQSYDIQTAGHIDTLKMLCKTSLKANQLLDLGDVDGAQKMLKMYDMLMRSGKFTAAQNKENDGAQIDSVSELVMMCERDGFIPRFYTDGPQDKVDRTLQDLQSYTKDLIMNETNLGDLIDKAVKDISVQKEKEAELEAEAASDEDTFEAELFSEDKNGLFLDEDFAELYQQEQEQVEDDEAFLTSLLEEGEIR